MPQPLSTASFDKPTHITQLDGLRGVAALGVLLFHLRMVFSITGNPLDVIPGAGWLQAYGFYLVDLFFVISGYVFAHVYLVDGQMQRGMTLRRFAWGRFTRLWPLYMVTLLFASAVLYNHPGTTVANILLSAGMLHVLLDDNILNSPAWSISVECLCYLIFALAAAAGRKTLLVVAIFSIGVGIAMILIGIEPRIGRGLIGFFAGVLMCRHAARLKALPGLALFAAACIPYVLRPDETSIIVITLFGWTASVLLSFRLSWLGASAMRWIGDRSYAIYMCHVPILILVSNVARVENLRGDGWALVVAAGSVAIVLALAHILHERLERPVQKALRAWPPTPVAGGDVAATAVES